MDFIEFTVVVQKGSTVGFELRPTELGLGELTGCCCVLVSCAVFHIRIGAYVDNTNAKPSCDASASAKCDRCVQIGYVCVYVCTVSKYKYSHSHTLFLSPGTCCWR